MCSDAMIRIAISVETYEAIAANSRSGRWTTPRTRIVGPPSTD
jgi:hypothetical protein